MNTPRRGATSTLVLGSRREVGAVGLVAGMCGAYGAVLGLGNNLLVALSRGTNGAGALAIMLGTVATVFVAIAVYVAAVVISHCVDTVVAGRQRQIALLRLERVPFIDATGLKRLESTMAAMDRRGVRVLLAGANLRVLRKLVRAEIVRRDGPPVYFGDLATALRHVDAARGTDYSTSEA